MALTLVQVAGVVQSAANSPFLPLTQAFANPNAAGNTLIVWAFACAQSPGSSTTGITINDTQGNSYNLISDVLPGYLGGACVGCFIVPSCAVGANSVTHSGSYGGLRGGTWCLGIIIAEFSGIPSPTVEGWQMVNIFGVAGNSPTVLSVTDSHGSTVTDTCFGASGATSPSGGIGTIAGVGAIDIASGGVDYRIVGAASPDFAAGGSGMTGVKDSHSLNIIRRFASATGFVGGLNSAGPVQLWVPTPGGVQVAVNT